MIRLSETIDVPRPVAECFAYTSDFANVDQWDPGVAASVRLDEGPVRPGSRYRLTVTFGPRSFDMEYAVTAFEPPDRVVLEGHGGSVHAVDEIRFRATPRGTRIDYTADLSFDGLGALAEPFLGPVLERTGRRSVEGLREALSRTPDAPRLTLANALSDQLVLPGLLRFTRLGFWLSRRSFGPLAVSLRGRTVVLTGATSGLGRSAAESLARLGARVVLVGRDQQKTERTRDEIRAATGNDDLGVERADLSLLSEVRGLADRLLAREGRIDVLVNNAAVLEDERVLTPEGFERSLATNLLAPFVLTRRLLPRLVASAPSRIVNVVSGGMYLSGLAPLSREGDTPFDGTLAYARHKRALMVLTELWAQELSARGIAVNAMHPGWAETPGVARSLPLFRKLTAPLLRSPEEGADTMVWLAAAPESALASGALLLDREPHPAAILPGTSGTPAERTLLLEELAALTGERAVAAPRARGAFGRAPAPGSLGAAGAA